MEQTKGKNAKRNKKNKERKKLKREARKLNVEVPTTQTIKEGVELATGVNLGGKAKAPRRRKFPVSEATDIPYPKFGPYNFEDKQVTDQDATLTVLFYWDPWSLYNAICGIISTLTVQNGSQLVGVDTGYAGRWLYEWLTKEWMNEEHVHDLEFAPKIVYDLADAGKPKRTEDGWDIRYIASYTAFSWPTTPTRMIGGYTMGALAVDAVEVPKKPDAATGYYKIAQGASYSELLGYNSIVALIDSAGDKCAIVKRAEYSEVTEDDVSIFTSYVYTNDSLKRMAGWDTNEMTYEGIGVCVRPPKTHWLARMRLAKQASDGHLVSSHVIDITMAPSTIVSHRMLRGYGARDNHAQRVILKWVSIRDFMLATTGLYEEATVLIGSSAFSTNGLGFNDYKYIFNAAVQRHFASYGGVAAGLYFVYAAADIPLKQGVDPKKITSPTKRYMYREKDPDILKKLPSTTYRGRCYAPTIGGGHYKIMDSIRLPKVIETNLAAFYSYDKGTDYVYPILCYDRDVLAADVGNIFAADGVIDKKWDWTTNQIETNNTDCASAYNASFMTMLELYHLSLGVIQQSIPITKRLTSSRFCATSGTAILKATTDKTVVRYSSTSKITQSIESILSQIIFPFESVRADTVGRECEIQIQNGEKYSQLAEAGGEFQWGRLLCSVLATVHKLAGYGDDESNPFQGGAETLMSAVAMINPYLYFGAKSAYHAYKGYQSYKKKPNPRTGYFQTTRPHRMILPQGGTVMDGYVP